MDSTDVFFSVALTPVVTGIVEAIKAMGLPVKASPILAICLGIILRFVVALAEPFGWTQFPEIFITGITIGLAASGLYSGTKTYLPKTE